jgi:hypothetical protein
MAFERPVFIRIVIEIQEKINAIEGKDWLSN